MRLSRDQIGGLFMLVISGVYSALIFDIPVLASASGFDARSMPIFLAGLGIFFSLILICRKGESVSFSGLNFRLGLCFIVLLSLYSVSLRVGGFLIATVAFLVIGFWLLGERNLGKTFMIAALTGIVFWLIMSELLGVYLPPWPEALSA